MHRRHPAAAMVVMLFGLMVYETLLARLRPDEFERCLHLIADGKVDVDPWITGHVGLDGVAGAFTDLGSPEKHCKVLVNPYLGK